MKVQQKMLAVRMKVSEPEKIHDDRRRLSTLKVCLFVIYLFIYFFMISHFDAVIFPNFPLGLLSMLNKRSRDKNAVLCRAKPPDAPNFLFNNRWQTMTKMLPEAVNVTSQIRCWMKLGQFYRLRSNSYNTFLLKHLLASLAHWENEISMSRNINVFLP